MSIRILLADDSLLIRKGLRELITIENDMEVVAEASTGQNAVANVIQYEPDIVVLNIDLPDISGMEITRMILEHAPYIKVIALSIHSTRRYVDQMLAAGVSGYVVKHCAYDELVKAIRIVMKNKPYIGFQVLCRITDNDPSIFSSDRRVFSMADYSPERRSGSDRRCLSR